MDIKSSKEKVATGNLFNSSILSWHVYFGVLVFPVLFFLAVTGVAMLLSEPVERQLNRHLLYVEPQESRLLVSQQSKFSSAYPDKNITLYVHSGGQKHSSLFVVSDDTSQHGGGGGHHQMSTVSVFLNPYTGAILGEANPSESFYNKIKKLHGTLWLGNIGDAIIEASAGLCVLLALSGLIMAVFFRKSKNKTSSAISNRAAIRKIHKSVGLWIFLPLILFLLSGLAWTNLWGGKIVQPWGSLPGTKYVNPEVAELLQSQNIDGLHQVPWAAEQKPIPKSKKDSSSAITLANNKASKNSFSVDDVVSFAEEQGLSGYRVHLPKGGEGVWTLSSTTIAGDVKNPAREKIIHFEKNSGKVLQSIGIANYPIVGKMMAAFVPWHQGDLGLWNVVLNVVICLLVMALSVTGLYMVLKNITPNKIKLNYLLPNYVSPKALSVLSIACALFPLSGVVIVMTVIIVAFVEKTTHKFNRNLT